MSHPTRPTTTTAGRIGRWATFIVERELFGFPVEDVQEVLMPQPLTPVPLAPPHIVGLLNLRGQIMPAVELRRRLSLPPRDPAEAGGLLVVKTAAGLVSVVVDEIGDVLELDDADHRPPPDTLPASQRGLISGICPIAGRVVIFLRVDALDSDPPGHE